MQVNEYQKAAMATLNPALDKKDVLINSVMGLCGESGEAIDIVKKWLMQGHELDKERLVKELGDVAWYLAEAATALDVPHEPLTDEGYIPCVSLLDFQKTGGKLDMTAYCRALDFGCKAYVNLVMLHLIQKEIAEKTGIPCGKLILIVKSAHFYLRDREKVLAIIEKVH